MRKSLAIHSYKGGTGKTLIASNLAIIFAKQGFNVCLLDYDFRAPSLQVLFRSNPKRWLNNFLEEDCDIRETLVDLTAKYDTKGKLFVGFANPSSEAMREMMTKDRKWEMGALHKTLSSKKVMYEDFKVNYLIFDTSPGLHYSSINALASSDLIALVMKMDEFDVEGTKELIRGIYDVLGRKTGILLNRVPVELISSKNEESHLAKQIEDTFKLPILGIIGCYCDLLLFGSKSIYAQERPDHQFVHILVQVAKKLERLQ